MQTLKQLSIVLLLLLNCENAFSQSNDPAPPNSRPPTRLTTPDQRGTDQNPLTVKILPSSNSESQAREAQEREKQNADSDKRIADETKRLADYTRDLVHITYLLFAAASLQIGLFFWQLRLIQGSAKDGTKAANAATEQARLARQAFENVERPYLLIFDVMMPTKPLTEPQTADPPPILVYDVGNFGKLPATIDEIWTGAGLRDDGRSPDLLRPSHDHRLIVSDSLRPDKQQSKITQAMTDTIVIDNGFRFIPHIPVGQDLSFRIVLRYRGPFSRGHETSGWWRYDPSAESFVRCGGDEYNYVR